MTLRKLLTKTSYKNIFNYIFKNKYKHLDNDKVILIAVSIQKFYDKLIKIEQNPNISDNLFLFDNAEKTENRYFFEDIIDLEIVSEKDKFYIAQEVLTNNKKFILRKE
jgi:hypothetical protein